jgi:hypothetical protein
VVMMSVFWRAVMAKIPVVAWRLSVCGNSVACVYR